MSSVTAENWQGPRPAPRSPGCSTSQRRCRSRERTKGCRRRRTPPSCAPRSTCRQLRAVRFSSCAAAAVDTASRATRLRRRTRLMETSCEKLPTSSCLCRVALTGVTHESAEQGVRGSQTGAPSFAMYADFSRPRVDLSEPTPRVLRLADGRAVEDVAFHAFSEAGPGGPISRKIAYLVLLRRWCRVKRRPGKLAARRVHAREFTPRETHAPCACSAPSRAGRAPADGQRLPAAGRRARRADAGRAPGATAAHWPACRDRRPRSSLRGRRGHRLPHEDDRVPTCPFPPPTGSTKLVRASSGKPLRVGARVPRTARSPRHGPRLERDDGDAAPQGQVLGPAGTSGQRQPFVEFRRTPRSLRQQSAFRPASPRAARHSGARLGARPWRSTTARWRASSARAADESAISPGWTSRRRRAPEYWLR